MGEACLNCRCRHRITEQADPLGLPTPSSAAVPGPSLPPNPFVATIPIPVPNPISVPAHSPASAGACPITTPIFLPGPALTLAPPHAPVSALASDPTIIALEERIHSLEITTMMLLQFQDLPTFPEMTALAANISQRQQGGIFAAPRAHPPPAPSASGFRPAPLPPRPRSPLLPKWDPIQDECLMDTGEHDMLLDDELD
ncbi:hypothetical protein PAXRUDRAFT_15311 [Paxillus rubicundulus Ve08.2h10]|uniref:Uncharacterized protein n=1 Tax=Paxillus rubicundulus Ve08.2h10 TaxID=930991 RepID=A0A0D0D024_9AGAM|nr:hypothetical protein PAXRUDRAFT_15311 [Paxillus rubicundulus Ve08.2h10]